MRKRKYTVRQEKKITKTEFESERFSRSGYPLADRFSEELLRETVTKTKNDMPLAVVARTHRARVCRHFRYFFFSRAGHRTVRTQHAYSATDHLLPGNDGPGIDTRTE